MKLREALAASNCNMVRRTGFVHVYSLDDINIVEFELAEKDLWSPVIEKKPTKTKLEGWVNVYKNTSTQSGIMHTTKEEADRASANWAERIACVYVSGEYEECE